ncbi:MAG: hypothetical protein ACTHM5_10855 [Ginsengibacter sp.]
MAILLLVSAVCSSVLFIFSFNRELFYKTDSLKLLLLGLAITLPIWLLNSILAIALLYPEKNNYTTPTQLEALGAAGSGLSFPVLYIPILAKFFLGITLFTGALIAISTQLIILIIVLIINFRQYKKKEK